MKHFLKIFIPILMTLALLISVGWYFFRYDPNTTRDLIVSQARYLDEQGNHTLAAWFYELAYRQSGNDVTVALELSEQYRTLGNYTKAEHTLTNAIADGGTVDLYIALCKLYVEQNKLLDAVTMLDRVSNPTVKEQLDAMRPAAPVPTHQPGYYNQYIPLSFYATDGIMYATLDGSYPSTKSKALTQPIGLSPGETTIQALIVGENGLVSPVGVYSYTITGVIEEVTIEDPAMDQAIRQLLQVSDDHILYSNELWSITALRVPADAKSLSDIKKLPFLNSLSIENVDAGGLSSLKDLSDLEELYLYDIRVTEEDLATIANLPKLKDLTIGKCSISTISPLSKATKLTTLNLSNNTIRDLSALESMADLIHLNLSHNAVKELTSLSRLTKLEYLDLSYNSIESLAPLSECIALRELNLSNNALTALDGLSSLVSLEKLNLSFTSLTNVSALAANTALTELNLSNNALTDIAALAALNRLQDLNFSYNQVSELPEFSKDTPLVSITGTKNQLTSLKSLSDLLSLNYVNMEYNPGITSAKPLESCYSLIEVNVIGTAIQDVSALQTMGVIVLYVPI